MIALWSALRGQVIRSRYQPCGAHENLRARTVEGQRGVTCGRIHDLVLELQEREADGVGEWSSIEIYANHIVASDVFIVIYRVAESEGGAQQILEVRVAVKQTRALGQLIVQPAEQIIFAEGIGETSRVCLEW